VKKVIWVVALHGVNRSKVASVMREMEELGPPSIRCVEAGGYWYAIEGTHRLAAAFELGITPDIIEIDEDSGPQLVDLDGDEDEREYAWIYEYVTQGPHDGAIYQIDRGSMRRA
jgi:hypothetical protein